MVGKPEQVLGLSFCAFHSFLIPNARRMSSANSRTRL